MSGNSKAMWDRLLLTIFSILHYINLLGQLTYPSYRQYTLRDGLPQMQVTSLFQDSRGYIWIGTKGGLSCFNGQEFRNFKKKDLLPGEYIQQVTEDFNGLIWISTNKGIVSYDGKAITSHPSGESFILELAPATDGKIWFSGADQNNDPVLGYYENRKFNRIEGYKGEKTQRLHVAYDLKSNSLVIVSTHTITQLSNKTFKEIYHSDAELFIFRDRGMIRFLENDINNRLKIFELKEGKMVLVAEKRGNGIIMNNKPESPFNILSSANDNKIISVLDDSVKILDFKDQIKNVILTDMDNHLWIGSEEGLLQVFSKGFETYKREVLPGIWGITEDKQHRLWMNSYERGLYVLDGTNINFIPVNNIAGKMHGFNFHPVVDKRGRCYFPNNLGLLVIDRGRQISIANSTCLTSFYDEQSDQIWTGGRGKIDIYDARLKLIKTISGKELNIKGFVNSIHSAKEGEYWIGSFFGITRFIPAKNLFVHYNRLNGRLPDDGILSIYTTPDGTTWFAGTSSLLFYDEKTDSIKKIENEYLTNPVSFVNSIDNRWLLISQSKGLYLMNLPRFRQTGKVELQLFNEQNGFLGIDPGQDGAFKDASGNIWMTTSTEVVKLNPHNLDLNYNHTSLRISQLDGISVPFKQNIFELPHNNRSAILHLDAVCFNRPDPVEYSWRFSENNSWSDWDKGNYMIFTNLLHGTSKLEIRARVPGLPNSEVQTSIILKVNLAMWNQRWFLPALIATFSIIILLSAVLLMNARSRLVNASRLAKTFQLQAVLSQLNPHFIFNVLATVQSKILSANMETANEYLVRLGNLIRSFLDTSISALQVSPKDKYLNQIPLSKELDILDQFIRFQQLIHPEKFNYFVDIASEINPLTTSIPPMLIQPFVENAIRHGLLQKEGKGRLHLKVSYEKDHLIIAITDDGIGIKKATEKIQQSRLLYTSHGKDLTMTRIRLLNETGYHIQAEIQSNGNGTTVILKIKQDEPVH